MSPVLPLSETLEYCPVCSGSVFKRLYEPDICRCSGCGVHFRNPRPAQDAILNSYESGVTFDQWQHELEIRARLWAKRYALISSYRSSGTLLDIGTGDGYFLEFAKAAFTVEATEMTRSGVHYAAGRGHKIHLGTVYDREFDDKKYDVITLWHVLEHLPAPNEMLTRIRQLLNRDGILVIAVPNETLPLLKARYGFTKRHPFGRLTQGEEIHLVHFTPSTLVNTLRDRFGFEILDFGVDDVHIYRRIRRLPGYWASKISSKMAGWHWDKAMVVVCAR